MMEFTDMQWITFWVIIGTFIYILGKFLGGSE